MGAKGARSELETLLSLAQDAATGKVNRDRSAGVLAHKRDATVISFCTMVGGRQCQAPASPLPAGPPWHPVPIHRDQLSLAKGRCCWAGLLNFPWHDSMPAGHCLGFFCPGRRSGFIFPILQPSWVTGSLCPAFHHSWILV